MTASILIFAPISDAHWCSGRGLAGRVAIERDDR